MIKFIRFGVLVLLTAATVTANAQSTATTSSPYSRYGLGDYNPAVLPTNIGMGGISTAINTVGLFNNINPANPASYSKIGITVIDAGLLARITTLNKTGQNSQSNNSFRLSHLAFGIPVSKRSALAFGLMPYTEMGYNYRQKLNNFGTGLPADTNAVNYIYSGDGGLSKIYLGYGFGIGSHLSIGANASYIFGNLKETQSTEIPNISLGVLNSRVEESNAINGFNYDFGAQYSIDFSLRRHLTFGYSGSANTKLNTQSRYIVSNYYSDSNGDAGLATDSIVNRTNPKGKVQLPLMQHFGISYQNDGKFLIGADYSMGKWSELTVDGVNRGLRNSRTVNVGGQFTPNINSLSNYWASVDYRLGFIMDDTYMVVNNTNIKRYAGTIGFGLPLRPNNSSFYKINLAAEVGRRGTLASGLVKENYINLHLSFTLNDKWFQKYRFD
ncbi:hypothetical protein FPZ43_05595 [Mucilaginibacter pallidiroseus]|uniref:Long-chain fatty acid transport protein n=1 Tax=Mucilaginibacter pallidiroseus TaxID=2599295 RepID=A0A563UGC0_9SPHI|nr:hypothetical protein [Mucilaginibacter pallidiroseus]TWR30415.1 hypothetical protein FPZ43_05595 [Mucilaginibacter pallidiroseus]